MENKKSYIPVKVFLGYLVLATLFSGVSWFLYSKNKAFSETENAISKENNKILRVGNLLSNVYKTEGLSRITIQSNSEKDFNQYLAKTESLKSEIDSLKPRVTSKNQVALLDSVKGLLSKKTTNIRLLKALKNKANDEMVLKNAITDLTKMEFSLRKLQLEDFVKNPSGMATYQRNVLKDYVAYLNQNIPDDSTNTLSKRASDSILSVSKNLLNEVKNATAKRKEALNAEENKLLQNELSISEQLRKIMNLIEHEMILNTARSTFEKEKALQKTNQIVTAAAIIGLLLTSFFIIWILNDFSKTESYKKQLEIANSRTQKLLKNREQLITTVSHDLKTPLSTILGYTELLEQSAHSKKQTYYTQNIKSASQYISKLVQDLLDFTQIEAGKITLETIPYSLPDILREVAKNMQALHDKKPILLQLDIDKSLENRIMGDPFRLRQILTNLIGNAYKFTAEGFLKIEVKALDEKHRVRIRIEDSGIGIKAEKQHLIFEEFTQADDSIEKKYGGTGLGLTISKKMIAILGGELNLESVYGKGSVFEILLPLVWNQTTFQEVLPVPSAKKLTAILVDDDINLIQLTAAILRQHGYTVHPFNTASQALKALESTAFDFLITDIQMPETDGFLFLERLQNSSSIPYKNQPLIAITGKSDVVQEVYKKAGFATVIRKPFSPKTLLETIDLVINSAEIIIPPIPEIRDANSEKYYSLVSLISFLPNDQQALKDVLLTLETSTVENLALLEQAISENKVVEIKVISHRMCPMFKQIKANAVSKILDDLELNDHSATENVTLLQDLKTKIEMLFVEFRKNSIL